jgi:hypothetical protein
MQKRESKKEDRHVRSFFLFGTSLGLFAASRIPKRFPFGRAAFVFAFYHPWMPNAETVVFLYVFPRPLHPVNSDRALHDR